VTATKAFNKSSNVRWTNLGPLDAQTLGVLGTSLVDNITDPVEMTVNKSV